VFENLRFKVTSTWPARRSEHAVISKHFDVEKEKGSERDD
jgi:hypothetical protein